MSDSRAECAQGVRALAAWAAAVRFEDIPRPVLERAVRVLADDLAAMIGARGEPEVAGISRAHAGARQGCGSDDLSRRPAADRSPVGGRGQRRRRRLARARRRLPPRTLSRRPVRRPFPARRMRGPRRPIPRHAARAGRRLRDRHADRADVDAESRASCNRTDAIARWAPRRPWRSPATPMPTCCVRRSPVRRR